MPLEHSELPSQVRIPWHQGRGYVGPMRRYGLFPVGALRYQHDHVTLKRLSVDTIRLRSFSGADEYSNII